MTGTHVGQIEDPAAELARFLAAHAPLRRTVACVMSFSFPAIRAFWNAFAREAGNADEGSRMFDPVTRVTALVRVVWLLDNPTVPYAADELVPGETTFPIHTTVHQHCTVIADTRSRCMHCWSMPKQRAPASRRSSRTCGPASTCSTIPR